MKELRPRTHSPEEMGLLVTNKALFAGPTLGVTGAQMCLQKPSQVTSS